MKKISITETWCKGCWICGNFCPKKVFDRQANGKPVATRAEDCIGCRLCEYRCPDFAIKVEE